MASAAQISVPSHVRPELVVDFDFYNDARYKDDIHDGIAQVVAEGPPVFWTPRYGGHWVIAGHAALFDAVRDTDHFSSEQIGIPSPPPDLNFKQVPIQSDPPDHARYRAPLNKAFSPKSMNALQEDIRQLAGELLDKVRAQGHCDFQRDVAEIVPVSIFLTMMGLPLEKLGEYRKWVGAILKDNDARGRALATKQVVDAMSEIVKERETKRGDDLISRLWDTEIDGRPVTFAEMQSYCLLLFIAGLDTVTNGMCFGTRHLAKNPQLQAELRADPSKITIAMEEFLRRYSFAMPGRVVKQDYDAFGANFKSGDRVLLLIAGADLDGKAYPNPMEFDLNRENNVHMAFNSGPHRCVGSHLARIEMRIVYEELLKRIPEFRLDPDNPPRFRGGHIIGCDSLPLLWDPA